jgi:hypothetical protein
VTTVQRGASTRVIGLKSFVAELKAVSPEFARELSAVHREIARMIRDESKSAAGALGSTAAHVAPSIRATGTQKSAAVTLGGDDFPMAMGAEFGSIRFHQFQAWRGNDADAGYFVYPTIRAHADDIERMIMDGFTRVADHAFPD